MTGVVLSGPHTIHTRRILTFSVKGRPRSEITADFVPRRTPTPRKWALRLDFWGSVGVCLQDLHPAEEGEQVGLCSG